MIAAEWEVAPSPSRHRSAPVHHSPFQQQLSVRAAGDRSRNASTPADRQSGARGWGVDAANFEGQSHGRFEAIRAPSGRLPVDSAVRRRYAQLARLYMRPFPNISRSQYMDYLDGAANGSSSGCSGCFLVQVKDGEVFAYDPQQVRSAAAEFRELRMREAVHWATRAVQAGAVDNTEFVISTTDGVVSTSHAHSYRMPERDAVPRPIFTMTHCNCSSNIPYPQGFTDLLRRGFKDQFWRARSGSIARWDEMATGVLGAKRDAAHVWARKKRQAVFRGAIRIPSSLANASDYERNCGQFGRTALFAQADAHARRLAGRSGSWAREYWLWDALGRLSASRLSRTLRRPTTWRRARPEGGARAPERRETARGRQPPGASVEPLLDVQLTGSCGGRTYRSDGLTMEQQSLYRYVVHAEGNGFWADRLAIQLFGSSAIIKQLTPCGMFFEPLLRAYRHYIPVDYQFRDVVRQVEWARANDERVRQIVVEARAFAGDYLTVAGISAYAEEVLREYTRRLDVRGGDGGGGEIHIHPRAIKLYPVN
jgi:hypothetical protein